LAYAAAVLRQFFSFGTAHVLRHPACIHDIHCFAAVSGGRFSSSATVLGRLTLGGIAFGHLRLTAAPCRMSAPFETRGHWSPNQWLTSPGLVSQGPSWQLRPFFCPAVRHTSQPGGLSVAREPKPGRLHRQRTVGEYFARSAHVSLGGGQGVRGGPPPARACASAWHLSLWARVQQLRARVQRFCARLTLSAVSGGWFSSSAAVLGRLTPGGIAFGHLQLLCPP